MYCHNANPKRRHAHSRDGARTPKPWPSEYAEGEGGWCAGSIGLENRVVKSLYAWPTVCDRSTTFTRHRLRLHTARATAPAADGKCGSGNLVTLRRGSCGPTVLYDPASLSRTVESSVPGAQRTHYESRRISDRDDHVPDRHADIPRHRLRVRFYFFVVFVLFLNYY